MTIADELGTFNRLRGPACRAVVLGDELRRDLVEALASPAANAVVARWWNATRGEASVRLTGDWVSRHRLGECATCR